MMGGFEMHAFFSDRTGDDLHRVGRGAPYPDFQARVFGHQHAMPAEEGGLIVWSLSHGRKWLVSKYLSGSQGG